MLHPALSRALAAAHIEDLHRPATPQQTIRLHQGDRIASLQKPLEDMLATSAQLEESARRA